MPLELTIDRISADEISLLDRPIEAIDVLHGSHVDFDLDVARDTKAPATGQVDFLV